MTFNRLGLCCLTILTIIFLTFPAAVGETATWPEGPVYSGSLCTLNWVDILTTGTAVQLGDDEAKGPFPIGFDFEFYGQTFGEFFISSNGMITFGTASDYHNSECPLPKNGWPENFIAPQWDDLDPSQAIDPVLYQSFEQCPIDFGACLVIEWNNFCHYPDGPTCDKVGTFEVILYEDGTIQMQFLDAGDEAGLLATTGIEGSDPDADHGLTYACSTADALSDNLCLAFSPRQIHLPVLVSAVCGIAHLPGATGTEWRSSLAVANPWGPQIDILLSYYVAGTLFSSKPYTLAAGGIVEWQDVVPDLFGITESSKGAVFIEADRPVVVSARTFNQGANGTFGQFLPGLAEWEGLWEDAEGVLTQLKSNADFRTNIGFFNLGEKTCTVQLQLHDSTGAPLGNSFQQPIERFVWEQLDDVFAGHGTHDTAYAMVEVTGTDCNVWAYASVIDIKTGDPTTVPLMIEPALK